MELPSKVEPKYPTAPWRTMPWDDALRWLRENDEQANFYPGVDTKSLVKQHPHLGCVDVREVQVETPTGSQPGRIYRDENAKESGHALVWVHGGAFVRGNIDIPEAHWVSLELASRGIPVFNVEYSKCLGNVHYPVPSDDVMAAWIHATENAEEFFGVSASDLMIGGGSAGSALSGSVTVRLRDNGKSLPAGVIWSYPVLHPDGRHPEDPHDPIRPYGVFALEYAGSHDATTKPHVLVGNDDGVGFPPTFMVICEKDPLRPSGEAFAKKLQAASVPVDLRMEVGADHGHLNEPADSAALKTIESIAEWIWSRPRVATAKE